MENKYLKVTELNKIIQKIFYAEEMLHGIVILGEVSGFRISGNHAYFNLKDEESAIAISDFNYKSKYIPKEGEQLLVQGKVDYYPKGGKLSFVADKIMPYGEGALAAQLEKLKQDLLKKGYFAQEHKLPIPKFPKRVCVITARTGAVIRDIITTVRRCNNNIDIVVMPVKVQGVGAEDEIVDAIKLVDDMGFDALIIARGGGSLEDLMPFNAEKLVYAIYNAKTPIISSVGHETDTTLCDLAADIRVPTPTAAGELVGYDVNEYLAYIDDLKSRVSSSLSKSLENALTKLEVQKQRIITAFNDVYSKNKNKLELYSTKLGYLANNCLILKQHKIEGLATKLDAFNPAKIFTRSFAYISKDGSQIKSINDIQVNDNINITTDGGKATAQIIEVKKNEI